MEKKVLGYHSYRELKPGDDHDIVALFLFSLRPARDQEAGKRIDHNDTFWTEATLSRDLASRGAWASLSREDKLKAMFSCAQERIVNSDRKLRQAPLFWSSQGSLNDGPPWDLAAVKFPKPHWISFEPGEETTSFGSHARQAAGL